MKTTGIQYVYAINEETGETWIVNTSDKMFTDKWAETMIAEVDSEEQAETLCKLLWSATSLIDKDSIHSEYTRGICEIIADTFGAQIDIPLDQRAAEICKHLLVNAI